MFQFSSPVFTSPTRTRPSKDDFKSSNPFTPIRNLFQAGRVYLKSSPPNASGPGAITLGKRRRTVSSENDEQSKTHSSLDLSPGSPTNWNSPIPSTSYSPPSSPSTVAQSSSSPPIISSPSLAPNQNPAVPPPPPPTPTPTRGRSRVALQNMDDTYNAVVITALEDIPFCCHEDLLTMSRPQLVAVAHSLNAKLPAVMRIDISAQRTDFFIRRSIEVLVGISKPLMPFGTAPLAVEPPGAPKAMKSRKINLAVVDDGSSSKMEGVREYRNYSMSGDADMNAHAWPPSSPGLLSSPLAKRVIIRSTRVAKASELGALMSTGMPKLAPLEEEDESLVSASPDGTEEMESSRLKKRRKLSEAGSRARGRGFRRWSGSLMKRNEVGSHPLNPIPMIIDTDTESKLDIDINQSPPQTQAYHLRAIPSSKALSSSSSFQSQTRHSDDTRGQSTAHNLTDSLSSGGEFRESKGTRKRSRSMIVKSQLPEAFNKLALGRTLNETNYL
ncbi:hypothetical protein J3R30DRAFT_3546852 [Lentinula aciculospora]|uniref:Uncharacterized protein n=1 Tax=Lentinula aciculospora TaxID=153920 RepID=A0A9W8ZYZ9_9AGAR|nr:hypothetical protein J3R30DRAFT_3546852 [Lentinula aciculospora]